MPIAPLDRRNLPEVMAQGQIFNGVSPVENGISWLMAKMGAMKQNNQTNYGLGNIDLTKRPVVKNPDGSISTILSMSFNEDGNEVLVPMVSQDGRILSNKEAIDYYHKTGQFLGKFKTPEDANAYADQLHKNQAQRYVK